jgi:uncharacterized protein YdaU (DUF1376 family)
MNYYERYPGDYGRDTAHLTLAQHGAYTLMLDYVYGAEKPMPKGRESVYRICKAMDKAERAAVDKVLDEFWDEGEDGWTNRRVVVEISKAQPRIAAAKLNGGKGGRPKKNGNPEVTQPKPTGLLPGIPPGTHGQTHSGEASPTPIIPFPNGNGAMPPVDPIKALYDTGVQILIAAGSDQKNARSVISKLRQVCGDAEAASVVMQSREKTNPTAWIMGAVNSHKAQSRTDENGNRRAVY